MTGPRLFYLGRNPQELPSGWRNLEADPERAVEVIPGIRVAMTGTGDVTLPDGSMGWGATIAVWDDRGPATFMDAVLVGTATVDQVDDWVDDWHEGRRPTLRSVLGLTDAEYSRWVMSAASLEKIVAERRKQQEGPDA